MGGIAASSRGLRKTRVSWYNNEVRLYSPVAQSVEREAVNFKVVGSSPTRGA